jgi:cyclohexyl-isocyanide hydratase
MRVTVVVYPGMTAQDMIGPITAWSALPGAEIEFVWKERGPILTDSGVSLLATHAFGEASAEPDVLFIGGGMKPTIDLLEDDATLDFLARQGAKAKWVTSVCTGSLVLGAAGLLRGYRAACHWAAGDALAAFGAIPTHERVVIDRNRATGGGVTAGIDFGITLAAAFAGAPLAKVVELMLEYAPAPPYGCGRPELADDATRDAAIAFFAETVPVDAIARAASRFAVRAA